MTRLIKVDENLGRGTRIFGIFEASDLDWERIQDVCGRRWTVRFGEVAGKHSAVDVIFTLADFQVVSEDETFIDQVRDRLGLPLGLSILNYLPVPCPKCDGPMHDDEGWCEACNEYAYDEESE